jgi:hypothetical protein
MPLVDLDALALLAPPGEGSVTLRASLYRDLLDELRELRRLLLANTLDPPDSSSLTPLDREMLAAIMDAPPTLAAALLHAYYADADRADRTPRGALYLHLGLLIGLIDREAS